MENTNRQESSSTFTLAGNQNKLDVGGNIIEINKNSNHNKQKYDKKILLISLFLAVFVVLMAFVIIFLLLSSEINEIKQQNQEIILLLQKQTHVQNNSNQT